jgi:chorismate mutase
MKFLFLILFFFINCVSAESISENKPVDEISSRIFSHISTRLSYMQDVAYYKVYHGISIQDVTREHKVLESAKQTALESGLQSESFVFFAKAQIAAAKGIQYRYAADLMFQSLEQSPKDLKALIRPELIKLDKLLVEDVSVFLKNGHRFSPKDFDRFSSSINVSYLSINDKKHLFDALMQIKLATTS